MSVCSLVALGSGRASTIEFFCEKTKGESRPFQIKAIVTDRPGSGAAAVAKKFKLPCHILEQKNYTLWDQKLRQTLLIYKPRLILLAGFLKKIGPAALSQFPNQIINSHPSLLPEFSGPGMYGSKVHRAVVQAKKKLTGVSIHIVNANYDEGPVVAQKAIAVKEGESAEDLEKRVKKIEKDFYFETVLKIISGEIALAQKNEGRGLKKC